MKNFLLVHGAWHAACCWKELIGLLEKHHQVIATDLPGHGQHIMPWHEIHFSDYVKHIIHLLDQSEQSVSLVGHSFAGMLISQVACLRPQKVKELIYINALIPHHGESLFSLSETLKSQNLTPYLKVDEKQHRISIQPLSILKNYMYNRTNPKKILWDDIQSEPLLPMTESVDIDSLTLKQIPQKAIIGFDDKTLLLSDQIQMCERSLVPYQIIDSDHCPFLSNPEALFHKLQLP